MSKWLCCAMIIALPFCFSSCFVGKKAAQNKSGGDAAAAAADTSHKVAVAPVAIPKTDTLRTVAGGAAMPAAGQDTVKRSGADETRLIAGVTPLWKNRISYKTCSGKAKVNFDGPDNKQEFTATFRVAKDSLIWINITLGLSIARILITPDSFYVINYVNEELMFRPLSEAAKVLPAKVDFASIQNLLVGEPLREGIIRRADSSGGYWTADVEDSAYTQQVSYSVADSSLHTLHMTARKNDSLEATEAYSDYQLTPRGRISQERELNMRHGPDLYSLILKIEKIEFDQPLEFPFAIPRGYSVK